MEIGVFEHVEVVTNTDPDDTVATILCLDLKDVELLLQNWFSSSLGLPLYDKFCLALAAAQAPFKVR